MKIIIAAATIGEQLKVAVKNSLEKKSYEVIDASNPNIFTATMNVVKAIKNKTAERGIIIDDYAIAPFMIASKNPGIICAPVYEDYTAKMTRAHNSTQIICLGAAITAEKLACSLSIDFVKSEYDGGRHQVRIDMLNRML